LTGERQHKWPAGALAAPFFPNASLRRLFATLITPSVIKAGGSEPIRNAQSLAIQRDNMNIIETKLKQVMIIDPQRCEDERGFFASSFSEKEFAARGMASRFVENNISFNKKRGTLRGMHYQIAPHGQAKLVRCTRGAVYDVAVDLRPDSPTYAQWVGVELTAESRIMLYVPHDFAHGYQTLEDDTEVFYMVSQPYAPESYRGVRWDDPAFDIQWPKADQLIMIERDTNFPDFIL
jgi:dTDP-4-dehydrorhamnose 3,5-epimerase